MCKGQLNYVKGGIEVRNSHQQKNYSMEKEIELNAIYLYYTQKEYKSIRNKLQRLKYPRNKLGGIVSETYAYFLYEEEDSEKLQKALNIKNVHMRIEVAKTKLITHLKDTNVESNKKVDSLLDNLEEMINS